MTKKTGVKVTRIQWDTDGRKVKCLPKEVKVKLERIEECLDVANATDEQVGDVIGDILTKDYEFCHNGFKWTWLTKKMTPAQEKRAKVNAKVREFLKRIRAKAEKAVKRGDAKPIDEAEWKELESLVYKLAR